MRNTTERQPVGSLKISGEVIATIASVAALEIEGVDSLVKPSAQVGKFLFKRFGKKNIDVTVSDDFVEIDIQLVLKFGAKIAEVCAQVQSAVKDSVQTMTGMAVSKVNVTVADIAFVSDAVEEKE